MTRPNGPDSGDRKETVQAAVQEDGVKAPKAWPARKAPVTLAFIVFLLLVHVSVLMGGDPVAVVSRYALVPGLATHGEPWRLLTAVFLHANWSHVLNNAFGFWIFGDRLGTESMLGSKTTFTLILLTGVIGNIISCVFMGHNSISLGASGATYGLLGAYFGVMICYRQAVRDLMKHRRQYETVAVLSGDLSPEETREVLARRELAQGNPEAVSTISNAEGVRGAFTFLIVFIALHYYEGHLNLSAHLGGLFSGIALGWLFCRLRLPKFS